MDVTDTTVSSVCVCVHDVIDSNVIAYILFVLYEIIVEILYVIRK